MKATLKEEKGCVKVFTVTAPWSELKDRYDDIVDKLQKGARLPGFRAGKAPASMIKGRFKKEIRDELIDGVLPDAAEAAIKGDNLEAIVPPTAQEVKAEEGEEFSCEITIQVPPVVPDMDAKGLTLESPEGIVQDEQIDKVMENLRQKAAVMKPLEEPAEDGDIIYLTMKRAGGSKGQERTLMANSKSTDPVEKQLPGKKIGDAFDVKIEEPEKKEESKKGHDHDHDHDHVHDHDHDHDHGHDHHHQHANDLAPGEYSFTVDRVLRREIPEVDDDFAKDMGATDLQDLREKVKADLKQNIDGQIRRMQESQLVEKLFEKNPMDVPPGLVDRQLRGDLEEFAHQLASQGIDPEKAGINWQEIAEEGRVEAEKKVATYFLLDKVAETNNIETQEEEVDTYIEDTAKAAGVEVGMVRAKYEKEGKIDSIKTAIRHKKAMDLLLSQASIKIMEAEKEKETKDGSDTDSSRAD